MRSPLDNHNEKVPSINTFLIISCCHSSIKQSCRGLEPITPKTWGKLNRDIPLTLISTPKTYLESLMSRLWANTRYLCFL